MNVPRLLTFTLLLPLVVGCGSSEIADSPSPESTQADMDIEVGDSDTTGNEDVQYDDAQEVCVYLNDLIAEHATHDDTKVKFWIYSDGFLETKWETKDVSYRIQVTDVSLESIRVGKQPFVDEYNQEGLHGTLSFEPKDGKVFKRSDTAFHNPDDDSKAHYISLKSVDAAERGKRALVDLLAKAGATRDPYADANGG